MSTIQTMLQRVSEYFNLGLIQEFGAAMGTNQNYFVTTNKGQFLFKILVNTTREEALDNIQLGLPYFDRLEECHFPAAAYYLKEPNGSCFYVHEEYVAVVLPKLDGEEPPLTESICREVGKMLAQLHLVLADDLPEKKHWLDKNYLPQAIVQARQMFGDETLKETLKEYQALQSFRQETFPQSIIHGDLDPTNCLFVGEQLSAFLDWQEMGKAAAIVDVGSTILGFCFIEEDTAPYHATFMPHLYKSLLEGYMQVRPLTSYEYISIEQAVKLVGLTQPVWSMLTWEQYHPDEEMKETNLLFWRFGLDTWKAPNLSH